MKVVLLVLIVANALWPPILACINVQVAFEQIMPFAFTPNAPVRLKCDVNMLGDIDPTQGNFSVRVDWFRNGKPLPIASSSSTEPTQLIASSCNNNETAGWYGCIVKSKYGTLKVPEVPTACKEVSRPRLLLHHGSVAVTSPGSLVMLECRVDRLWSPLLELPFVWTLNGTRITSESSQTLFAALPCRDLRPTKAPSSRSLHLPSLSQCLYIWSFGPDTQGSFACAVQRGGIRQDSEPVDLRLGANATHVFPLFRGVPLVVNVRTDTQPFWIPCAARDVLFEDKVQWLTDSSHASVPSPAHPFLLLVKPKEMQPGQQRLQRCTRRGQLDTGVEVLLEVLIRVFPSTWIIQPCLDYGPEPQGFIHRINDSLQLHCKPSPDCHFSDGSLTLDPTFHMFEIDWFLNGRKLRADSAAVRINGSSLSIPRLEPAHHSGFFQCRVRTSMQLMPPDERWNTFLVLVSHPVVPLWLRINVTEISQRFVRLRVELDTSQLPLCGKLSCRLTLEGLYHHYAISHIRKTESSPLLITVDFNQLHPFHSYSAMCGYFDNGGKDMVRESMNISFRTLEDRPGRQPEFEIKEEGPGSLLVMWRPLEPIEAFGKVTRHRIQWRLITEEKFEERELPVNQYSMNIKGLLGNALYQVSVSSGTRMGYPLFEVGRLPLMLLGHTVPLDRRTLVPRSSIIDRVWKGAMSAINNPKLVMVRWSVKPAVVRFLASAVSRWNLTVLFSNSKHASSFFLPTNVSAKTFSWPPYDPEISERRVLVWLEALDARLRVLDDAVIAIRDYPTDFDMDRHALQPPVNVSVQCLQSDYGLLVRWDDQPANALCRNPQTGYSCFVRIRLIPLPFYEHRQRLYIRLSPYTNSSAINKGVFHVTDLQPDTMYSVGVAFERQPPLVSDFATPLGCRVLPLPLPIPNVTLVRRLDAKRVRVQVLLPRRDAKHPQRVQAVSAAAAASVPTAQSAFSRIKLVALRFCDSAHRPFPRRNPSFISPSEAIKGRVLEIPFPLTNDSTGLCRNRLRRRREDATFVQAAFCYERDRCAAWSDFVRVRAERISFEDVEPPSFFVRRQRLTVALIASLTIAVVMALVIVVVLAERLRRTRRQLRQRACVGNGVVSLGGVGVTSGEADEAEREPFVPPPHLDNLPRTKL